MVYYGENGALSSYTAEPIDVASETAEGVEHVLDQRRSALSKPVLTADDFAIAAKGRAVSTSETRVGPAPGPGDVAPASAMVVGEVRDFCEK
jgi:hypothetical protein